MEFTNSKWTKTSYLLLSSNAGDYDNQLYIKQYKLDIATCVIVHSHTKKNVYMYELWFACVVPMFVPKAKAGMLMHVSKAELGKLIVTSTSIYKLE